METIISNCSCGCTPVVKLKNVCVGHGDYIDVYWVESSCGIKGKEFSLYDGTPNVVKNLAIDFWNSHFNK
jgi:hypothetical protein